jgi:hypothetical protein
MLLPGVSLHALSAPFAGCCMLALRHTLDERGTRALVMRSCQSSSWICCLSCASFCLAWLLDPVLCATAQDCQVEHDIKIREITGRTAPLWGLWHTFVWALLVSTTCLLSSFSFNVCNCRIRRRLSHLPYSLQPMIW